MGEIDIKQKVKAALVFTAIQEIAIEEVESIKDTKWYKFNIKKVLESNKKELEKSVKDDFDKFLHEEHIQLAYFVVLRFMEKWTKKVTELNADQLSELDNVLDLYFKGEFKFVDPKDFENAKVEKG